MRRLFGLFVVVAVVATALISMSSPVGAVGGTYSVTNKSDANVPGSLRAAIVAASAAGLGTQTINVKVSGVIPVGSTLNFNGIGDLVINGNGVTLDGSNSGRVFQSSKVESTATLRRLVIRRGNTAHQGGGILNSGDMVLDRVTVTQNSADKGGGGIVHSGGQLTILRSKIAGNITRNTAPGGNTNNPNGGGILAPSGRVKIEDSLIINNRADRNGGGVLAARVGMINSTIANNRAGFGPTGNGGVGWGGGVMISKPTGSSIRFSTFSGNRTEPWDLRTGGAGANLYGGGNGTKLVFHANVLTNPKGSPNCAGMSAKSNTDDINVKSRFNHTVQNRNMGVPQGKLFCGPKHWSNTLSGDLADRPKLGDLKRNGGPTATMMPKASSPLVNAVGKKFSCPAHDQRGSSFRRPFPTGGRCDIGAVERR